MLWARNLYLNFKIQETGCSTLDCLFTFHCLSKFKIQKLCAFSAEKVHFTVRRIRLLTITFEHMYYLKHKNSIITILKLINNFILSFI